jgi:hypothetical protein
VTDEGLILDHDPLAEEAVALDLAVFADGAPFLDLDEGADLGVVPDPAAVEVDEVGEKDVGTEDDAGGDFLVAHG